MQEPDFNFPDNPLTHFQKWFAEAEKNEGPYYNAMTLSTLRLDGWPMSRVVLLKELKEGKFYFYTNYHSDKANEMAHCPFVTLNFFWQQSFRQVRIEGKVTKTSREQSVEYFHSRPRASQISAMASLQSRPVADRSVLERRVLEIEKQYKDQEIPCPENWGGFQTEPVRMEFWIGLPNRLHHRVHYELNHINQWTHRLLQP